MDCCNRPTPTARSAGAARAQRTGLSVSEAWANGRPLRGIWKASMPSCGLLGPALDVAPCQRSRDHAVRVKTGGQAVDALLVLQAPVFPEIVDALCRPVAHEAAALLPVIEQGHAQSARGLHEIDIKPHDLSGSRNFLEPRNQCGILRCAAH